MSMMSRVLFKNMLKPLEDQLRCHICSEFYDKCVMAPCSHNFCSVCIKKRIATESDCPSCFEEIGENDLRRNKILDKLVRFCKKIQRDNNSGDAGKQNQGTSHSQAKEIFCEQIDSDIQMILVQQSSVQETARLPSKAISHSPLIHSLQSKLTNLTNPVKIEFDEITESSINDVVMSTNSAGDSIATYKDIEQVSKLQKSVLSTLTGLCDSVKRIETKLDSLMSEFESDLDAFRPDQNKGDDDVFNMMLFLPANIKNFNKLNKMIVKNSAFRDNLRKILMSAGGSDCRSFTLNVMSKIISNDLSLRYSLSGKTFSSAKLPFQYTEVYKLILDVCCQLFSDCTENQVRQAVSTWFRQTKHKVLKKKLSEQNRDETKGVKSIEWNESHASISED